MNNIVDVLFPIGLGFIMFSLGLGLSLSDFYKHIKSPKGLIVGLLCQIILVPLIGFFYIYLTPISFEILLGLIMIIVVPGSAPTNLLSYHARGDVALSISLTAISSILSIFSIPLMIFLFMQFFLGSYNYESYSLISLSITLIFVIIIPVSIGVLIKSKLKTVAIKIEKISKMLSTIFFFILVMSAIYLDKEIIIKYFPQMSLTIIGLILSIIFIVGVLVKILKIKTDQKKTILIECGIQNAVLGIHLGSQLFGGGLMLITPGLYGVMMFPIAVLFIIISRFNEST
jgi:BASS family bile acid:Na+ symporter